MTDESSRRRSANYFRQVQASVLFKAGAVLASFISIPILIKYLGVEQFGVWSTILSVMTWLVLFDLGIGNGLKNCISKALAENNRVETSRYISAGYTLIGIISIVLWGLSFFSTYFIPWLRVFNTTAVSENEIRLAVQISLSCVLLNFWIGLVGAVLGGFQKTSLVALGQFYSNMISLFFVCLAWAILDSSIVVLAVVYGGAMLLASALLSVGFYRENRDLFPVFLWRREYLRPLLSVGVTFFTIQIAVLVVFTTDKILISQFFGPQLVTQYEVVMKIFALFSIAHALICAPLWPAYADAYHRKDNRWIRSMLHKQLVLFAAFVFAVLIMVLMAKKIILIWIGEGLNVSSDLILAIAVFVLISIWNNIYAMILNGVGRTNVQLVTAILAMVFNIPVAYVMVRGYGLGVSGVVVAATVSLLFSAVALPIQVFRSVLKEGSVE
jgi:O-antigen/teichoic acid export membrane protein